MNANALHTTKMHKQLKLPHSASHPAELHYYLPRHTAHGPDYRHVYTIAMQCCAHLHIHTHTCIYTHYHHKHHHMMQVAMCTHMHLCTPVGLLALKKHYRCMLQVITAMNTSEVFALVDNWIKHHQRVLQRVKTTYIHACMHA